MCLNSEVQNIYSTFAADFFKNCFKDMNKFKTSLLSVMLTTTATTAMAGGILTNTNQSIDFLTPPSVLMVSTAIPPVWLSFPKASISD